MRIDSATLHEAAGRVGALPSGIKPIAPGMRLEGPAFTVSSPPANNLWLQRAIAEASAGDVIVVEVGGHYEAGYWGEIMTVGAQVRGVVGLVIDGCVRDGEQIAALGFPICARGLCIRGTGKDPEPPGSLNEPIQIGDVTITPGDLIVGDGDGVVAIPSERVEDVLRKSKERLDKEAGIIERLRHGETTLDIYGLS
jgi:4-hydroxy-4-methyl-2-oxoglutarate aldolase